MHRIDTPDAVNGLFDDGNPLLGRKGTMLDAAMANAWMLEIINVILHAGIQLEKGNNEQLRDAIIAIATGGGEAVTAAGVSVADNAGLFAANNVEDALLELRQAIANTIQANRLRRSVLPLSGAAHTMQSSHLESVLVISHTSAATYTIPNDETLSTPVGTSVTIFQGGSGQVAVVAGAGVNTPLKPGVFTAKSLGQHASIVLVKESENTWRLGGMLEQTP